MSISPSELEYGEDDPEDEEPDKKQASGSSFEDIDIAVHTYGKIHHPMRKCDTPGRS